MVILYGRQFLALVFHQILKNRVLNCFVWNDNPQCEISSDIFLKILQQPAIPLKLLYPREDILATYLNNSGGSNPDFNCFTLPTRIPLLNVRYFYEQKQQSYCHRLPRHVDIKAVNPHIKYRQSND